MMKANDFQFIEGELIKYVICGQCNLVLRQPTRLHPCGHTFCLSCCLPLPGPCPYCKKTTEANQLDLTAINLISDLTVRCTATGCPFQGSYQAFINSHRSSCPVRRCGNMDNWMSQIKQTISSQQLQKVSPSEQNNIVDERARDIQIVDPEMMDLDELQREGEMSLEEDGGQQQKFIECIVLQKPPRQRKTVEDLRRGYSKQESKNKVIQL